MDGIIVTRNHEYERISGNPKHAWAFKIITQDFLFLSHTNKYYVVMITVMFRYMIIFEKGDLLRDPEEQDAVCSRKNQKFHILRK